MGAFLAYEGHRNVIEMFLTNLLHELLHQTFFAQGPSDLEGKVLNPVLKGKLIKDYIALKDDTNPNKMDPENGYGPYNAM